MTLASLLTWPWYTMVPQMLEYLCKNNQAQRDPWGTHSQSADITNRKEDSLAPTLEIFESTYHSIQLIHKFH